LLWVLCCCLSLDLVLADVLCQSTVVVLSGCNIWVSRQHLDRVVKGVHQLLESCTTLGDLSRLAQSLHDALVSVNAHVQVSLESVLRLSHQEETDLLGDRVTSVPQHQREVVVDAAAQVSHDRVAAHWGLLRWGLAGRWLLTWRHTSWGTTLIILRLLAWGLRIITLLNIFEIVVVCEMVIEFGVDNSFNQGSGMVSQLDENLNNDIHHNRSQ